MNKNYRIKDIAEMSGVSTGTVDRILHNRGKVSEEARKKVEKVLKEIDYHPNLIARSLALKKQYHFYTLIPSYETGEYWETFSMGITKAEQELFSYNVEITPLYFNQYDRNSFDRLIQQLVEADCQGVVIATLFKESVLELVQTLDKKEIPYVLIDAYIENTNCVAYYGTNSYDSGYIAGRLLFEQIRPAEDIAIFRFLRRGDLYSTQVQVRESGFRTYLNENHFEGRIYPVRIHADNQEENFKILDDFFHDNPNVKAGIIFNSRAHQLGYYFSQHPDLSFKLMGYDVIEENIQYLNSGHITHLIAQRPEVQGFNAVKALFRHLVLHEAVEQINYMPIDILIKENIRYYNNYI
ncbi:substrate-binding domain-containing protein [Parabacteroides sp. PF5-6]|uniref:LacI family DNA-binding transcriptional regulator n=1 Tax=Parabacteroides sp. PF5-6 TaxID=1742403 RepID=UPI002405E572|nr:substrate-binding domain-containing protein [Parabacteroides sp. PF5-6]MDF9829679.1 LacI family transcriptional regulator [Parabacteroides sp. PF5-6]